MTWELFIITWKRWWWSGLRRTTETKWATKRATVARNMSLPCLPASALCARRAREEMTTRTEEIESSSSNSSVSLPWWRNEHNEVIATVLVCRRQADLSGEDLGRREVIWWSAKIEQRNCAREAREEAGSESKRTL